MWEVTGIFEESDGTREWLFNLITYAYYRIEPQGKKAGAHAQCFPVGSIFGQVRKPGAVGLAKEELVEIPCLAA